MALVDVFKSLVGHHDGKNTFKASDLKTVDNHRRTEGLNGVLV